MEDIGELYKQQLEDSSFNRLFTPFPDDIEFVNPILDFELSPEKFMRWREIEQPDDFWPDAPYSDNCGNMCEYSCLYISMLLSDKKLKGKLQMVCGNFGFWEHYWMSYTLDGIEYFIDLTLQQFVKDAPKLAISVAKLDNRGYRDLYYMGVTQYINDQRAFELYTHPNDI